MDGSVAKIWKIRANQKVDSVDSLMEESVVDNSNELLFSFLGLAVTARGTVSFFVAVAVSLLILAVAWRLVAHRS